MQNDRNEVVARVVMLQQHMGFFTLENIALSEAVQFIQYIQLRYEHLQMHLYSDKTHYQLVSDAFLQAGFQVLLEKESYVQTPKQYTVTLAYSLLCESDETYITLFEKIAPNHKDRDFLAGFSLYGIKEASRKQYEDCMSANKVYRVIAKHNEDVVGLVFISELKRSIGGISYIGVVSEKRGNRYGEQLLKIASNVAMEKGLKQLIADCDVENTVMIKHLKQCDYKFSCLEKVFDWKR